MTHTVKTVKREIRVLGLDTCKKGHVFGAIVRGGLYLDGVVHHETSGQVDSEIAKVVLASKYFPELRLLMLHDPRHQFDRTRLEKLAGLATMEVSLSNRPEFIPFKSEWGSVYYDSDLARPVAEKILVTIWLYGRLPEPARIAHLLSRARSPAMAR